MTSEMQYTRDYGIYAGASRSWRTLFMIKNPPAQPTRALYMQRTASCRVEGFEGKKTGPCLNPPPPPFARTAKYLRKLLGSAYLIPILFFFFSEHGTTESCFLIVRTLTVRPRGSTRQYDAKNYLRCK